MTTTWDEIVASAVLGTERRPYAVLEAPGALGEALRAAPDLLSAATLVWAHTEAGRQLEPVWHDHPTDTVEDDRPLLPAGAVHALAVILGDRRFRPVLAEWLELAVANGGRLPGEAVPALLDSAAAEHRRLVAQVVGPLAGWLATRNPSWRWATRSVRAAIAPPAADTPSERLQIAALGATPAEALVALAGARPGPWSGPLSEAALAALAACVRGQGTRLLAVRSALPRVAVVLDPGYADSVSALIDVIDSVPDKDRPATRAFWTSPVVALATLVHFRRALHEEFS